MRIDSGRSILTECTTAWSACVVYHLPLCAPCYIAAPEALAFSFSSIFLLAAKIISSLFLCKFD